VTDPSDPSATDSVDEVSSTLNQLIETCKDGETGFRVAAEGVDDPNLQHLFESYSQQRSEFAAELQLEVHRLAQDPVDHGHAAAAFHRGWINIKAAVTGHNEGAIISECERGEDLAVQAYEQALRSSLTGDLRGVIERQFLKIKAAHDQVRSLERAHSRHS
jgi:uncharacterized protein (TIGR02284 family)